MALDIRKHQAPAGGETPRRAAISDLSLSIRDLIPVANTTERAQLVSDLTTAGYTPSAAHPLAVIRADAPAGLEMEYTLDGAAWRTVATFTDTGWIDMTLEAGWSPFGGAGFRAPQWRVRNGEFIARGSVAGGAVGTKITNIPAPYRIGASEPFMTISNVGGAVIYAEADGDLYLSALVASSGTAIIGLSGVRYFPGTT